MHVNNAARAYELKCELDKIDAIATRVVEPHYALTAGVYQIDGRLRDFLKPLMLEGLCDYRHHIEEELRRLGVEVS